MNTLFPGWANLKRVPRVRWSLPNHFIQVKVSGQPSSFGTDRKVSLYHLHTASCCLRVCTAILQAQGMVPTSSHAGPSNLKREGTSSGSRHSSKRKRHSAQPSHPNQNVHRGTPLRTDIKILPSQANNSPNFQQGKGKSASLIAGNVPSSRKRAKTEPTSRKGKPSVDVEVIDLTGIKREGSPIRVNFAKGETIDLTLEPDSD